MPDYLTNDEFITYYDARRVCALLSDTGTPIPLVNIISDGTLTALISAAEGEVNLACRVGRRYQVDSLITYATTTPGRVLKKLVADLTWYSLISRRGLSEEETNKLAPSYSAAQAKLELLRLGDRVFDIDEAPQAGLPGYTKLGINANGQSNQLVAFWGTFGNGMIPINIMRFQENQ